MARYHAHSANPSGEWHELTEHLRRVAELAERFASEFGAGDLGRHAGLWHDLGKFHPDFQEYLGDPERSRGPDHSSAGAALAARQFPLLAGLVAGHHGGLPDVESLRQRLNRVSDTRAVQDALEIAARELGDLETSSLAGSVPEWLPDTAHSESGGDGPRRRWELFLRMLFSALADADFLDTEGHFDVDRARARAAGPELRTLWDRFETHYRTHLSPRKGESEVNGIRDDIYRHCLAAAERDPGLFRLTVPTGGGKTLSGMGFALRHALVHGFDRVIVAIPYTSIIEQTADTYRGVFGDGVLEHHSAVAPEAREAADPVSWRQLWPRLASENWDAPIVVTTTVQLFESLFANRPGPCRKLHNLAGSVLILDEAQTLPSHHLAPILDALGELTADYRMSVVFCTATQPAVSAQPYAQVFEAAREIVPEPGTYFAALRRVTYEVPASSQRWSWQRVAAEMRGSDQCLAVVNTKADALALLEVLDDPEALHLSTNLCGAHRREVLVDVKERLRSGKPCRLVSTQVVEAGVDLDFPLVLRAVGPLDRIVQAAGRCNREGSLGPCGGRVVVFDAEDAGPLPPGAYRTGTATARALLATGCDLDAPTTYEEYFRRLSDAVELDREGIQALRSRWDFPAVARRFRLIDDDTAPIAVPWGDLERFEGLLDRIERGQGSPRALFRKLQPYVVNARSRVLPRYVHERLAVEIVPGLYRWLGRYDPVRGLMEEPGWSPEDLVV